jgi:hypothetical protein
MLHECGDCKAPKRAEAEVSLTLALHKGLVVGCITSVAYQGHESPWPKGFKELIDKIGCGLFDLIGIDGIEAQVAWQMIAAYRPSRIGTVTREYNCAECGNALGKPHDPSCGKRVIGCPNVVIDDCYVDACEVCERTEQEVGPLSSNERHESICDNCIEEGR